MLITILITAHPSQYDVYDSVMNGCVSLIAKGNKINQIFFMHEATYIASHQNSTKWLEFAQQNTIELQTCRSTAEDLNIQFEDYSHGFMQSGLSALADSILKSDATFQFGSEEKSSQWDEFQLNCEKNKNPIIFVFQNQPNEHSSTKEGIDLLLVLSSFDANLFVVFKGDGVKNLFDDDYMPRYIKRFKALRDFQINDCYVVDSQMKEFSIPVKHMSNEQFERLTQDAQKFFF